MRISPPATLSFSTGTGTGAQTMWGLLSGRTGERVYTVEGNSGDACKIKSYPVNYSCIKG